MIKKTIKLYNVKLKPRLLKHYRTCNGNKINGVKLIEAMDTRPPSITKEELEEDFRDFCRSYLSNTSLEVFDKLEVFIKKTYNPFNTHRSNFHNFIKKENIEINPKLF